MKYQQALHSDLSAIKELLESSGLPANDIEAHLVNFIVAKESNKVIGVGGWETCNEFALLRSFSVNKNHKCLGVAERILTLVEEHIVSLGVRGFYLLTDTALNYFERFGFYVW
jgi:N-acetylglutamate synthase-like GNAT family acetyltransferase